MAERFGPHQESGTHADKGVLTTLATCEGLYNAIATSAISPAIPFHLGGPTLSTQSCPHAIGR